MTFFNKKDSVTFVSFIFRRKLKQVFSKHKNILPYLDPDQAEKNKSPKPENWFNEYFLRISRPISHTFKLFYYFVYPESTLHETNVQRRQHPRKNSTTLKYEQN